MRGNSIGGKVGWIELQIHRVKGGSIEGIMM